MLRYFGVQRKWKFLFVPEYRVSGSWGLRPSLGSHADGMRLHDASFACILYVYHMLLLNNSGEIQTGRA